MISSIINRLSSSINKFEQIFINFIFKQGPPSASCFNIITENSQILPQKTFPNLEDILKDGFLWAVPKRRRTIEKRWQRKYGIPEYVWKPLKPKTHLLTCDKCGNFYEKGILCGTCYKKVVEETNQIKDAIQKDLRLKPVEKEVIVLYDGEKVEPENEMFKGKQIVEIPKKRPEWFCKNLLQKSTTPGSSSSDIKPTDLA